MLNESVLLPPRSHFDWKSPTMRRIAAILSAIPLLTACATSLPSPGAGTGPGLDRLVPQLIEAEDVAGIGIAVIENGELSRTWYYGEQEPGRPVDEDTVFNTASVAKTVLAELYIELDDRRLIDLDTPVSSLITHDDLAADERFGELTPRILLSHSSGLRNWPHSYSDGKLAFDFAPGEGFGYSGAGIELAARYASTKLGKDYRELVDTYVLEPGRLEDISPGRIEPWMDGHLARPKNAAGEWTTIEAVNANLAAGGSDSAADDLLATVPGYARFLERVIRDEGNHPQRAAILTSVLASPNYRCRSALTRICPEAAGHSIGWQVNRYRDHEVVFHSGSDGGENALVYFSPQTRDGAVIFVNGANGWVPMVRIVEALGQEPLFADYLRGVIGDILSRDLEPIAATR